ncbi:response regulator [Vibrio sp. 624788]|uniref:response regulator n=1 Tax=Vibrio sp. 624788 TaxID=1234362 RepID=UPI001F4D2DB0|nr:response regulator [Vibrio sp. 624788]
MNKDIKKYTVLVADDSRLVTSSVTTILRQIGFESISYAYKPFDVIHQCRQNAFDIIICDYNFQTQLTGYQLLEELKHARILKSTTVFSSSQAKMITTSGAQSWTLTLTITYLNRLTSSSLSNEYFQPSIENWSLHQSLKS